MREREMTFFSYSSCIIWQTQAASMRNIFALIFFLISVEHSSSSTYTCNSAAACGCSTNSATLAKIVGGEAAGSQTWGWAVSLRIGNSLCGGSVIAASWVLTAAHCVDGASASQITVYAGSNAKLAGTQVRSVSAIRAHPSYSSQTYVNDIALLQLSSPLNLVSSGVSAICLPSVTSATLSAGEWPPAGTTVRAQVRCNMNLWENLGRGCWLGSIDWRWINCEHTSTSDHANGRSASIDMFFSDKQLDVSILR